MSNVLSKSKRQQVLALGRLGWSLREIEAATGVRRETSSGYLRSPSLRAVRPRGPRLGLARDLSRQSGSFLHALASPDRVKQQACHAQVDIERVPSERRPTGAAPHVRQLRRRGSGESGDARDREAEETAVAELQHHARGEAVVARREGAGRARTPFASSRASRARAARISSAIIGCVVHSPMEFVPAAGYRARSPPRHRRACAGVRARGAERKMTSRKRATYNTVKTGR